MKASYSEAMELLEGWNRKPHGSRLKNLLIISFDGYFDGDMKLFIFEKVGEGAICELWQEIDEDADKIQEAAPVEMLNYLRLHFGPMQ